MALRGRSGASSAAVLLVIVALTGKLAFLTLSKKELQGTSGAVALLQGGGGGGKELDAELAHLLTEREQLASKYSQVTAAERERAQAARAKTARLASEHRELAHLQQVRKEVAHREAHIPRRATKADEDTVKKIVRKEFAQENLVARRRHARAEHLAAEHAREEAVARQRLEQQEIEAEARAEAKQELAAEGLLPAAPKQTAQQAHKELLIHEKNLALEQANRKLEQEARHMTVALQWAPRAKPHPAVGIGGTTGIGDPLAKAGVVEDSWGPITSTTATKSDPRDSFVTAPSAHKRLHALPSRVEQREAARDALHVLPNLLKRRSAAEHEARETKKTLEQELGFKSSALLSKSFDSALAQH